ncbi:MAG: hypothetical protein ABIF40_01835 [archaeon]
MKKPKLENVLKHMLLLDAKKYRLLAKIYENEQSSSNIHKNVDALKDTIKKQLRNKERLVWALDHLRINKKIKKQMIEPIVETIGKLTAIEKEQYKLINEVTFAKIITHKIRNTFSFNKKTFFLHQGRLFKRHYKREIELNRKIAHNIQHNIHSYTPLKKFDKEKEKFYKSFKLLRQIQEELRELERTRKNVNLVQKHAQQILHLIEKVQHTLVYEFIEDDINKLKVRIEYVLDNPNESKMTYFLTSIYLVSPGTFELTFIILFIRYSAKYAIAKTKRMRR